MEQQLTYRFYLIAVCHILQWVLHYWLMVSVFQVLNAGSLWPYDGTDSRTITQKQRTIMNYHELSWTTMNYHQLSHKNSLQSKQMSEKTNETTLQGFAASRRWSPPAGGSGSGCAACQFEILWLSCWDPLGYAGMTTSKKIHNLGLPGAFKSTMVQGLTTPKLTCFASTSAARPSSAHLCFVGFSKSPPCVVYVISDLHVSAFLGIILYWIIVVYTHNYTHILFPCHTLYIDEYYSWYYDTKYVYILMNTHAHNYTHTYIYMYVCMYVWYIMNTWCTSDHPIFPKDPLRLRWPQRDHRRGEALGGSALPRRPTGQRQAGEGAGPGGGPETQARIPWVFTCDQ